MIPDSALPMLRASCRTLQIIVLALATGVCIFAVIAVGQTQGQLTWELPPAQMQDSVFLLMGMMTLVGSFVVPTLVSAPAANSKPPTADEPGTGVALQAAASIQTRTITACALVEGGAFANLLAVFTHGYGPCLVLAAVLMSMIVLRFPTWSRYQERVEAAMRRSEERA